MKEIIKAMGLKKIYMTGDIEVRALDGVALSIGEGEFLSVVGTSGSGKSTLLNLLGGLDRPTEGWITVRGVNLADLSEEELAVFRRENIGFVFQNFNLIPVLTAYENIVLPLKLSGAVIEEEYIHELAVRLEIEEQLCQLPETLSGGQQQRTAIARALAARPAIVLADEPTGNLDSATSRKVLELMKNLARELHQTMAIVTHDERVAAQSSRVIRIEDGRIIGEKR